MTQLLNSGMLDRYLSMAAAFGAALLFTIFAILKILELSGKRQNPAEIAREQFLASRDAPLTASELRRVVLIAGMAIILVFLGAWGHVVFAVMTAVLCVVIIKSYPGWVDRRYLRQVELGVSNCLDIWVRCLRAGMSLQQAIDAAVQDLRGPIQREMATIQKDIRVSDIDTALWRWHDRLPLEDVRYIVLGTITCRQTGGKLSDVMENISASIHSRMEMREKVNALTSMGRTEAYAMGAMPAVICSLTYLMEPSMIGMLFFSLIGVLGTLAMMGWESIGVWVIWKIVNIKF